MGETPPRRKLLTKESKRIIVRTLLNRKNKESGEKKSQKYWRRWGVHSRLKKKF